MNKSPDKVLKEIFKRLKQEIRLYQILARKSQRGILRKSKNKRSNFDDNVYFSDEIMLINCCFLEGRLQKLKDEFIKEGGDVINIEYAEVLDEYLNNKKEAGDE